MIHNSKDDLGGDHCVIHMFNTMLSDVKSVLKFLNSLIL